MSPALNGKFICKCKDFWNSSSSRIQTKDHHCPVGLHETSCTKSSNFSFLLLPSPSTGGMCPFRHISGEKTVVCKHWLRGLCKKGDQCEFLHEYDMTKMPECYFYSKFGKGCCGSSLTSLASMGIGKKDPGIYLSSLLHLPPLPFYVCYWCLLDCNLRALIRSV